MGYHIYAIGKAIRALFADRVTYIEFFLKIAKTQILVSLPHYLTDYSRKARGQTKQRMATILQHNNKLTSGMCLLRFRKV